jgi:hypothetical protein
MAEEQAPRKVSRNSEAQRSASAKRDADFFAERKAREAANLEKTLKLRALRLAHEATLPKVEKPKSRAKKKPS